MTADPVPVAVVGAGNMGSNHVRVYDELPEAELTAVVEPDNERAQEIREKYDITICNSVSELSNAQAVSISVPNEYHRTVAQECAEMGLDMLIEKPLALTVGDAEAIVETAAEHDVVLQVGHIERFNPSVMTLGDILETEEVIAIEANRSGPFNEHLTTESVVFDLMIHDLDVVNSLVAGNVEHLNAVGTESRSELIDHAIAQFKFSNGVVGTVTASHVTHGKIRTLNVTTREAYIKLDYQEQDITIQRRGLEETKKFESHTGYRTETITETPFVRGREPLKIELEHFLGCSAKGCPPDVSGETGVKAVDFATKVLDLIDSEVRFV